MTFCLNQCISNFSLLIHHLFSLLNNLIKLFSNRSYLLINNHFLINLFMCVLLFVLFVLNWINLFKLLDHMLLFIFRYSTLDNSV